MSDSAYARIQQTPALRELYELLLARLDALGPFEVEHRKSGVHLVAGTGFLAVRPAADGLAVSFAGAVQREVILRAATDLDEIAGPLVAAYRAAGSQ